MKHELNIQKQKSLVVKQLGISAKRKRREIEGIIHCAKRIEEDNEDENFDDCKETYSEERNNCLERLAESTSSQSSETPSQSDEDYGGEIEVIGRWMKDKELDSEFTTDEVEELIKNNERLEKKVSSIGKKIFLRHLGIKIKEEFLKGQQTIQF